MCFFKKKERKRIVTTKLFFAFIFINCTIIEAYSMWVMYILSDLSALNTLIGSVVAESVSFGIYCCKSYFETKEEERMKFEYSKLEAASTESESCSEDDGTYYEEPTSLIE